LDPRSEQGTDIALYPLPTVGHLLDEDASQGIATFIDQVNKFTSQLNGPVPGDLTAWIEYQQTNSVIMRTTASEVVRTVERKLGLGRQEINDEDNSQTWSNGMLTFFEMIVEALHCESRELKYLVHRKGEVVQGIVDGTMVLAPCLLNFEVTELDELLLWESNEGRELKADLEWDEI
jgi:hypothetical protein